MRREEKSYSIKRLWEIKRAFQEVGLSKSGIKIGGTLCSIHVDYSKFYDIVEDLFKGDVSSTLTYIDDLLEKTDIEIDLSDLGFLNY